VFSVKLSMHRNRECRLTARNQIRNDVPSRIGFLNNTVAKQRRTSRRIPKARRVPRPLSRRDVTRGEYNRIVDILNERNVILNALRDGQRQLEHDRDVQFKRIAQLQAELDEIRLAWEKIKLRA
jgi:hypothetical protein